MKDNRCYSDQEWARAVSKEWKSYDPAVDLNQLKFFRSHTNITRPPRWSIGAAELWNIKRRELEDLVQKACGA